MTKYYRDGDEPGVLMDDAGSGNLTDSDRRKVIADAVGQGDVLVRYEGGDWMLLNENCLREIGPDGSPVPAAAVPSGPCGPPPGWKPPEATGEQTSREAELMARAVAAGLMLFAPSTSWLIVFDGDADYTSCASLEISRSVRTVGNDTLSDPAPGVVSVGSGT